MHRAHFLSNKLRYIINQTKNIRLLRLRRRFVVVIIIHNVVRSHVDIKGIDKNSHIFSLGSETSVWLNDLQDAFFGIVQDLILNRAVLCLCRSIWSALSFATTSAKCCRWRLLATRAGLKIVFDSMKMASISSRDLHSWVKLASTHLL